MNSTIFVLPVTTTVFFIDYYLVNDWSPLFFIAFAGMCFACFWQQRHVEAHSESMDRISLKV